MVVVEIATQKSFCTISEKYLHISNQVRVCIFGVAFIDAYNGYKLPE